MEDNSKKNSGFVKKFFNVLFSILFIIFLLFTAFVLVVSISAKKSSDGASSLFGYQMRTVLTASMEKNQNTDVSGFKIKSIRTNSLVIIQEAPVLKEDKSNQRQVDDWYASLKVGDVLTFRYYDLTQETITHRIVSISKLSTGGYTIVLRGDNVDGDFDENVQTIQDTSDDTSFNYVVGKVVGSSYLVGLIITWLKQPIGIALIIIVPSLAIIIYEVVKIVKLVNHDRKNKKDIENQLKDDEIAKLKEQLNKLQEQANEKTNSENN